MNTYKLKQYLENSLYNAALLTKTSLIPFSYKNKTTDGIRNRLQKMDARTKTRINEFIYMRSGNVFDDSQLSSDEKFMLYMRYQFVLTLLEGINDAEHGMSETFVDIVAPSEKLDTFLFISLWDSLGYMWIECAARILKNNGEFPPYQMTEQMRLMFMHLITNTKSQSKLT